jgi:hypothetical protein
MFLKNPKTHLPDSMLTLACAGFVFSIIFATTCAVAAWVTGNPDYMKYTAELVGVVITPTVAAYTLRKNQDSKTSATMSVTPEPEEKE